jgi:hypothetical protein
MSILEQYRSCTDFRQILRILQKTSALEGNFLWQTIDDRKSVINLKYLEIDFIAREVQLSVEQNNFDLKLDRPLFVKLSYRDCVFKVEEFRLHSGGIHFLFPQLIKVREFRRVPRHTFLPAQDKFVTLKSSFSHLREGSGELKVRALDMTPEGLGLIISDQNRTFLKNNRLLWITGLQHKLLDRPIMAEVVYVNSEVDRAYLTKREKLLKVGLKLSSALPQGHYQEFMH